MEVLVTGGAGYIGSHTVVELVEKGFQPIILDSFSNANPSVIGRLEEILGVPVRYYEADCRDEEKLRSIFEAHPQIESVIHFAAFKSVNESISHPDLYYQNNLNSLTTLLKLMVEKEVHQLVFSSSCTVYGEPDDMPVTEQSPIKQATNPYGHTKQLSEEILTRFVQHAPLKVVLLRYFNPIGAHASGKIGESPGGIPTNLVPYLTQTAVGLRDQLTIFGKDYPTRDGTCMRDFIHVTDLAEAHVSALQWLAQAKVSIDAFNLGSGDGATVLELVQTFEKVTGISLPYTFGERREGDIPEIYADASKANKTLNWKSSRSLSTALEDAWRWEQYAQKLND